MAEIKKKQTPRNAVVEILERSSRVIGLPLCIHDYRRPQQGIPERWLEHFNPACLAIKREKQPLCASFCGGEVHAALRTIPHGRIHTCPFGYTEIAVPIMAANVQLGVLFAGPCQEGKKTRRENIVHPPDRQWLYDRLLLVQAIARLLADHMTDSPGHPHKNRRADILAWLQQHMHTPVALPELAASLHLSPSRTSHLLKEIFGMGFARLLMTARLDEAARLLCSTTMPIADIALSLAFTDQSHFTNRFHRHYGMPPLPYRRQNVQQV